jgi:hypothetical protein
MNATADYKVLIDAFLDRSISVEDFQYQYLDLFKNDQSEPDEPVYLLLDALFGDIDSYTTDTVLLKEMPHFYLDEEGLRRAVAEKSQRLATLLLEAPGAVK